MAASRTPHSPKPTESSAVRDSSLTAKSSQRVATKVTNKTKQSSPGTAEKPFVVRRSAIQGRGVFAARKLRKGERILEYTGEHIGHVEAGRRYNDEAMERHHTFLFAIDADTCIDGGRVGNEARFINHACEPNCEARNVRKRIYIHALRTIATNEELSYDYAYELEGPITMADVTRYPCHCGSDACRGTLLAPKLVLEALAHAEAKKQARAAAVTKSATKKTTAKKAAKTATTKTTAKKAARTATKKTTAKKATKKPL